MRGNWAWMAWSLAAGTLTAPADEVRFSVPRGIYSAPVSVALNAETPGVTVRFTTDGSTPTATLGSNYSVPLAIGQTTVLRAAAFQAGLPVTQITTHTYIFPDDVIRQSPGGAPPTGWPAGPVNDQQFDYGMDPEVVNGREAEVKAALTAIPSVSLATDLGNLVSPTTGIYVNAGQHGIAWERPVSVELINDPLEPAGGFHENGGLRIRGNFSRAGDNPKHAFRLFFRSEYGAPELRYPLFGLAGTDEFDGFDIQCPQDFSWSYLGDSRNNHLREVWFRDSQRDLGQPHPRGRFVHLYLNGQYWGLYQIEERPEASFARGYLGGEKSDYDVIKATGQIGGYTIEATDGNLTGPPGAPAAYELLWQKSRAHFTTPTATNYFGILGLAADGTTPTADPVLLDVDNLIDYMLVVFFGGNADSPLSAVLGNNRPNNFYAIRSRATARGFTYYFHDAEMSLDYSAQDYDRTGPFINSGSGDFTRSNPQYTHQDLFPNPEYRVRFGDRAHRALFGNGALTPPAALARLDARAAVVGSAILGESARWGDAQQAQPFTDAHWRAARDSSRNWLANRHPIVLQQLKNDGLYPAVTAPRTVPPPGEVEPGTGIIFTEATEPVLFTLDGSDPRQIGGSVHPAAQQRMPVTGVPVPLISHPSIWRYLDDGSAPGPGWTQRLFNDTAWLAGASELGYGDEDETTEVRFGPGPTPDPNLKWITTYFRQRFTLDDIGGLTSLRLELKYDDGAVVYLNGAEVARANLPAGAITAQTPAAPARASPEENEYVTFELDPARLVAGINALAVEIHQSAPDSSDISLSARLTATRTTSVAPVVLDGPAIVPVRARSRAAAGGEFSALVAGEYLVGVEAASPLNLAVTEILYRPDSGADAEFVELRATGNLPVDLRGVRLASAVDFTFPQSTPLLAPGECVVLVRNREAFEARYGTAVPIAGVFLGALDNSGERLAVMRSDGTVLADISYAPDAPWPLSAGLGGHSLVLVAPAGHPDPASPENWRSSVNAGGTPGTSDATTFGAWKSVHGVTDDSIDADADGWIPLSEYALGGSPTVPGDSRAPVISLEPTEIEGQTLDFIRVDIRGRAGADDVESLLESSPDLISWIGVPLTAAGELNHGDGSCSRAWRSAAPLARNLREFWRVRFRLRAP